jgi:hypothetical protein
MKMPWLISAVGLLALAVLMIRSAVAQEREQPPPERDGQRGAPPDGAPRNQAFQQFGGGPRMLAVREALDKDKDGKVSADEIKAGAESLKALDRNKDGKLTADEIGWPPQFGGGGRGGRGGRGGGGGFGRGGRGGGGASPEEFAKRIMARDVNGDGKVAAGELARSIARVMELGDENKDGALDEAEARRFAEKHGSISRPAATQQPRPAEKRKEERKD